MSDPTVNGWSSIDEMTIEFGMHSHPRYASIHKKLNAVYGHSIDGFDDIFTDDSKTALKANASQLVTDKVIASITENAVGTENVTHIKSILNSPKVSINCPRFERENLIHLRHLNKAFDDAVKMEKDYIRLVISINLLHFHPAFIPENFGHISTVPTIDELG